MSDFEKYLGKLAEDLGTLATDMGKIAAKRKEEGGKEPDKKGLSLKSIQPVTKIYKSKEDLESAKQNPDYDFIMKQLEKIFEG